VPSIYIGINGTTDGNPLTTIKLVNAELEKLKKSFPPGLNAAIAYDSTEFIQASINEVIFTLAQAALIVIIVIFLFLGSFRSTLIPLVTIPLSIIGVLFYMQIMGYSINLLTLLAMVMAIGLLVDDAILVVENIYRHIGEGLRPLQAALQGAREIAKPVIATTIVLCVVYAPIGLLGGLTGVLFKEFAFTLVGTIIISTIIALTLSPMMCSRVLRPTIANNAYARFVNDLFERIHLRYEEILAGSLKTRSVTIIFVIGIVAMLVAMFQFIQNELAPEEDQGVIFTFSQAPDHTSIDYLNKYTGPYIDIFREYESEYESSFMANGFAGPTVSFAGMLLKPWEERSLTSMEIIPRIQQALDQQPGLQSFAFNPPSLPGASGNTPVEFILKTQQGYDQLYGTRRAKAASFISSRATSISASRRSASPSIANAPNRWVFRCVKSARPWARYWPRDTSVASTSPGAATRSSRRREATNARMPTSSASTTYIPTRGIKLTCHRWSISTTARYRGS
jgi:multidrug efflux pump